ncbi:hypothetical protein BDV93DRAFT_448090 [Ceratobasidium sp. AG-I]|nr:hypothetical protein BDV93DRAFT_448090 [Ceratobasidium sp. AG-I]
MYEFDSPPSTKICHFCQSSTETFYRCISCLGFSTSCQTCLLTSHRNLPTHHIQVWNGSFWEKKSASSLGHVLELGHCGQRCQLSLKTNTLLVGDLLGFFDVTVRYCAHPGAPSKAQQLILSGLFPCSDIIPQSAFTLTLLDHFDIFSTLGKTSAYKFHAVITRITDPGFPKKASGRYRELLTTYRKSNHITNLRRSASLFLQHPEEAHPFEQSLHCIACPRPGFNFHWDEVLLKEIPYFRHWLSYDGNFRLFRKMKLFDLLDISFSDGLAYFSLKAPYREWISNVPEPAKTASLIISLPGCDNHKAGKDTNVRWGGLDETGIGACTCTSHGCFMPRGMVDFLKGERFIYGDYAFASAVKHLTGGGPLAIGFTYDIWCHWITNLITRATQLPSSIALPQNLDLVGGIPKWHLVGHEQSCYARYSLNNTQYVGRMEGEGCERAWANLNEHSGSTSEKTPGARLDAINNVACDWNFEKMIKMGISLSARFVEAKRMFEQQHGVFLELHKTLPGRDTKHWAELSIEAVKGSNGKWSSPLMDPIVEEGKFQTVVKEARIKESSTTHSVGKRLGVTKWLANGIELEHSIDKLKEEAKKLGSRGTPRQHELLNSKRQALLSRVLEHRKQHEVFMPGVGEPDHPSRRQTQDIDPEYAELGLPSSFTISTIAAAALSSVADLEKELRRATCNDALETIRNLLGAKALALKYKKAGARGNGNVTRAETALQGQSDKVARCQWRYNNSRGALFRLGASPTDCTKYLEVTRLDLKTLSSYLEDDSRGIGQGYAAISWIWRTSAVQTDDWQVIALRTEWFRSRERYKRWEEQLILLKREMVMAARDLQKRQEIWCWKASQNNCTPGMVAYGIKKSRFFQELSEDLLEECGKHIEVSVMSLMTIASREMILFQDPIVHFQWSEDWYKANGNCTYISLRYDLILILTMI